MRVLIDIIQYGDGAFILCTANKVYYKKTLHLDVTASVTYRNH